MYIHIYIYIYIIDVDITYNDKKHYLLFSTPNTCLGSFSGLFVGPPKAPIAYSPRSCSHCLQGGPWHSSGWCGVCVRAYVWTTFSARFMVLQIWVIPEHVLT